MAYPFIGEIKMFGGSFPPRGWALCNGQSIPISEHDALFNLIGTTYGGDGQVVFNLPDLRGRIPVHRGQGPGLSNRSQGETGGTETVTLTAQQIPTHSHLSQGTSGPADTRNAGGALLARPVDPLYGNPVGATVGLAGQMVGPSGGNQPHSNTQPYLCVNFIIALEGIYPPRN
jgi:microcystin-dependent protein